MDWQISPYTLPLFGTGLLTLSSAVYTYRQRHVAGSGNLLLLLLAITIWVFAYMVELSTVTLESKLFWAKVQYLGIVYLPVGYALFTLKYIGDFQKIRNQHRFTAVLLIIPLLTLMLAWTNEQHGLVWSETTLTEAQGLNYLVVEHGVWFWAQIGFVYLLLAGSTYWLMRTIATAPDQFRGQIILLVFGAVCPWVANVLYITNTNPFPNLDLTPFAFAVTAVCFTLALLRFKFLDIVPIARELVVEKLENGVIVLDEQNRVLDINQAAATLLEKEKSNIVGQPLSFDDPSWTPLMQALNQDETVSLELAINQTFFEATVILLEKVNDRANGRLITLHNITHRKETELLLQKAKETAEAASQAKTHFLTNMSHEIRTPLNAVVGMAEILRQTSLNTNQQEMVDVVADSSNTLLLLINKILDFARLESGNVSLKRQAFDLIDCLEASLELVQQAAKEKGITLSYTVDATTPTHLAGDPIRLRQILVNLLENGIKFSEEGSVQVKINHIQQEDGILLKFTVSDNGIGIAADQLDQLFLPFQQIDGSLTRSHGGNGLGLIISKRLVELMGGGIHLTSNTGKGTSVHFSTLLQLADESDPPAVTLRQSKTSLAGRRLLIVADEAAQRRQISKEARLAGLEVYVAGSAQEASYWVDHSLPFDVILLDTAVWLQNPNIMTKLCNKETGIPLPTALIGDDADKLQQTIQASPDLFAGTLTLPVDSSQLYDLLLNILALKANSKKARNPGGTMATQYPLNILLVEDNKLNRRVILNILGKLGYRADTAVNGRIAVEKAQKQRYQIILMDIQMPEMDGVEATKQILSQCSANERPYIIAVTAHALPGDREAYLAVGMNQYLSKPVTINHLVEALYQGIEFHSQTAVRNPQPPISASEPFSAPLDAAAPIDFGELAKLVGNDVTQFLTMMKPIFLEDTQKLMQTLNLAVENQDIQTMGHLAHTLKGTSASMGMTTLTQLSLELEKMAIADETATAPQMLAHIQAELGRVQVALAELDETAV